MDYIGVNGKSSPAAKSLLIDDCEGFPFGFQAIVAFKFIEAFSSAFVRVRLRLREP
jgi:hypothetical protein